MLIVTSQMYDDLLSLSPEAMVSACRREGIHWLVIVKGRSAGVDESEQTLKVKSVLRGYEEEGVSPRQVVDVPVWANLHSPQWLDPTSTPTLSTNFGNKHSSTKPSAVALSTQQQSRLDQQNLRDRFKTTSPSSQTRTSVTRVSLLFDDSLA